MHQTTCLLHLRHQVSEQFLDVNLAELGSCISQFARKILRLLWRGSN